MFNEYLSNRIKIKEQHIRNAYKKAGSLKGGFEPNTNLCKGHK
jgi:hypothetical protein